MSPQTTHCQTEARLPSVVETDERVSRAPFPIVGIGCSDGGLDACERLLSHLPRDTGMAFVVVPHPAPFHESAFTAILSRSSRLPVVEVRQSLRIEPNHVYVVPPNTKLVLSEDRLEPLPRNADRESDLPIDAFLQSLATGKKRAAVGVILSGTGSDGARGIRAVKAEGGIVIAQSPASATFHFTIPRRG